MSRTLPFVALLTLSLLPALARAEAPATQPAKKHLIEFGWDEPDPAFMRKHLAQMEATPFDGTVFHVTYPGPDGKPGNFSVECWSKRRFTRAELAKTLADLKAARSDRFNQNFL